jgi:hypothetical protein
LKPVLGSLGDALAEREKQIDDKGRMG